MRMLRRTILFITIFIFLNQLKAQDSVKAFHFPHKTGDMWEYFYSEGPMYQDTLQNFTIFDSTDTNGIIHIKQHAMFINPTQPPTLIEDTTKYWLDTVRSYVYGAHAPADSALIYKLDAQKGEQWIVTDFTKSGGYGYNIARIKEKWDGTVLGVATTLMGINYYYAQDSSDTLGLDEYYDTIAEGFGLIYRGGGEALGRIDIIGAVINGTLYGDTTVVSVGDKNITLPSFFKLYQNYPNPFNPSTTISFEVSQYVNISLIIYDILGREVKVLLDNKNYVPGKYEIEWRGTNKRGSKVSSGVYLYRLRTDKQTQTRSMILLK